MRTGHNAFGRAVAMMAAIAGIMATHSTSFAAQQRGVAALGPYESHGKGKTRTHNRGGTKAAQRAAGKRRNVLANRRAHRA